MQQFIRLGAQARPRHARMLGIIVVSLALALGVFAATAAAAEPIVSQGTISDSEVVTSLCAFPVTLSFTAAFTRTEFLDTSGNPTRIAYHLNEQDTFSANGKTLTGLPYTGNTELVFDSSGTLVHIYGAGVFERIPLPDGSLFLMAGRTDFINQSDFTLTPEVGTPGDLTAFCAALGS